jgi:outer membrane biogenesis lipoprotein LolB
MPKRNRLTLTGCVLLLAAGCATPERSTSSTADSPQDKAHRDQLSRMSQEDAEAVEAREQKKSQARRPADQTRDTRQKVIDQPMPR